MIFNILFFMYTTMKKIAGLTFSNATPMECLQDACYWVSTKILEDAAQGKKRPKSALEHNWKRVISQLEKMDLLVNDEKDE